MELIGGKVDADNITFELEHDARIIARNTGSTVQKVEEMMRYIVKLGLFEGENNTITCLKLARRLDKSMTSNPQMRDLIGKLKGSDKVMIESAEPMQDQIRLDKNRKDNINPLVDPTDKPKKVKSKLKFNSYQMDFAKWMHGLILVVNPTFQDPNFDDWANTIRLMQESNKRDGDHMVKVFSWANSDSFWCSNIQSPKKFRAQFDQLVAKMNGGNGKNQPPQQTQQQVSEEMAEINEQYERSEAAKARKKARENNEN